MEIKVNDSWARLTDWQRERIAELLLSYPSLKTEEFYTLLVYAVLCPGDEEKHQKRAVRVLTRFTLEELGPCVDFIFKKECFTDFPKVAGLEGLGDILRMSAEQFHYSEQAFHLYLETGKGLYLWHLAVALYTVGGGFSVDKMQAVTDEIKKLEGGRVAWVFLSYQNARGDLAGQFPRFLKARKGAGVALPRGKKRRLLWT